MIYTPDYSVIRDIFEMLKQATYERFITSEDHINRLLELLDDCETDYATWKARILNDYACCFLREENYSKAMEILDTSQSLAYQVQYGKYCNMNAWNRFTSCTPEEICGKIHLEIQ